MKTSDIWALFEGKVELAERAKFPPRTPCWRWLGDCNPTDGRPRTGYEGRIVGAARLACFLKHGFKGFYDPKVYACHTCDNIWCVNPNHTFKGSGVENQFDKLKWLAALSRDDLTLIKNSERRDMRKLATKLGLRYPWLKNLRDYLRVTTS